MALSEVRGFPVGSLRTLELSPNAGGDAAKRTFRGAIGGLIHTSR
jgi:hypothetical protein